MTGRLGTKSNPTTALLFRHVAYMEKTFVANYRSATSFDTKRCWALAGTANLALWLGWLRSSECFSLTWADVSLVLPDKGPTCDLPAGIGMVLLRLSEQTKSDHTRTADVGIAFTTLSGLSLGSSWLHRLSRLLFGTPVPLYMDVPLFCDSDGRPWTSSLFCSQFVYPCLYQLQAGGDAYLQPFVGDGNTIPDKFWSLHMYRRGARTHIGCGGVHNGISFCKASKPQIYEHGRWRLKRSAQAVDEQYNEWPYAERVYITLRFQYLGQLASYLHFLYTYSLLDPFRFLRTCAWGSFLSL